MSRILKISLIGIIAIIVAVFAFFAFRGGAIIKNGIETYGPGIVGAPVSVASVDFSILSGSAEIEGFILGNPSGFDTTEAINIQHYAMEMDAFSIFGEEIIIHSIVISEPVITYETGKNGSNLATLQRTMQGNSTGTTETSDPVRVVIGSLDVLDGQIQIANPIGNRVARVPLPDIHMENIGRDTGGSEIAPIVRTLLNKVLNTTISTISTVDIESLGESTIEQGKNIVEGAGEKLKDGIGSLLGKKNKDDENN